YGALHRTATPMGARRLRDWLSQPLSDVEAIRRRQDAVATWLGNGPALEEFRAQLTKVRDLERTLGRLSAGSGNARDLVALRQGLEQIRAVKENLQKLPAGSGGLLKEEDAGLSLLGELEQQLTALPDLVDLIGRAIVEEAPLALKEGGMIRDGFDKGLD